MGNIETIVMLVTLAIGVYILVASTFGLWAILKHKDKDYKKKYEEFQLQKERVKDRLEKARQSQKG